MERREGRGGGVCRQMVDEMGGGVRGVVGGGGERSGEVGRAL